MATIKSSHTETEILFIYFFTVFGQQFVSILLRLWFTSLLQLFTEREKRPKRATLFLIDECANLGKIDGLVTAITLLRSYGIRL